MIIQINKKERITADAKQWIYQIRGVKDEEWISKWFYPSLIVAYTDLLNVYIRTSNEKNLKDALEDSINRLKELKKEINKILTIKL